MSKQTDGHSGDANPALYAADDDANLKNLAPPTPDATESHDNVGRRAQPVNGAVHGSGAGAGGGGNPEDFDSDVGGSGSLTMKPARRVPDKGADANSHGSR